MYNPSNSVTEENIELTVFRSFLKFFSWYPRDILGVNSSMLCMCATRDTAVLRPTPLRPAINNEPPGLVITRSTTAIFSRTSLNIRISNSLFSRPMERTKTILPHVYVPLIINKASKT